ncbi:MULTISPECIES: hypothetical protein [unclassified Chryseobacterium]|uniref:hypothetical protein n=1 Tax=unclassified Chryseobacterium TaxID=2593645 RepID=UPI00100B9883|nr:MULTISPECIES: hypothetical protein [unclassified Chryseobacterium]RXM52154.1 hypothetical protein BOQ64_09940 [Chryseobacterium sp. CH25]RXM64067.1 hypothetical protein BOQ60_14310 [Chryseobacterium sp. CH1]
MATNDTKNNASQTLFRFVSLRNPQLTETKTKNLGFIHRPSTLSSSFDAVINPGDTALLKFQALERAAKSFNTTGYESENQIEAGSLSEALKIGRKIAKKEVLSVVDENTAKNLSNSSAIQSKMGQVWDNLIYQTVTQKNFYVKEALIHILKAIHYGYVADLPSTPELVKINGEDLKAKALEARVVLPMKFFGDGYEGEGPTSNPTGNAFQVNVSPIADGVINGTPLPVTVQEQLKAEGKKITELSALTHEKDGLSQLKAELEPIQKSYYKLRTKAHETAYDQYKSLYQKEIDRYETQLEKIESRIKEGMTEEEIAALYSELGELKVPPFQFTYKNEINFHDFKAKLSLDSLKLLVNVFTELSSGTKPEGGYDFSTIDIISDRDLKVGNAVVSVTDEYDTYAEVYEKLDQEISVKSQTLLEKSPASQEVYANVGGFLVPVVDSNALSSRVILSRSYYLQASYTPEYSRMPGIVTFYYQAESNAWGLASAKITASTDFGTFDESFSNIAVNDNKVTLPSFLINKFGKIIRTLEIRIYFNNGKETVLKLSNIEINQPYTGILYTEETGTEPENPGSSAQAPSPGTFIPKHFGVKRLGIADYLKVEQSVHAYVPGEVSNIENVMASELRHKSSVARDYSEVIDTTSESVETEKISDTSKAERNEMQSEVARELDRQQTITASTNFSFNKGYKLEISAGYANNTAQHDSNRQAVAKSQEITERAMERVLTKINKERVQKIIKEFTETNVHEFDNRGKIGSNVPPQHITGVYRWVDKKMKNQIYNYGKRTMFEFMIPEPAKLHRLAFAVNRSNQLIAPVDPRKAPAPKTMADARSATADLLKHWAEIYGVKLTDLPKEDAEVYQEIIGRPNATGSFGAVGTPINIPQNYAAKNMKLGYYMRRNSSWHNSNFYTSDGRGGERDLSFGGKINQSTVWEGGLNLTGSFNFLYRGRNIEDVNLNVTLYCKLSDDYILGWKQENFEAIIKAYEAAYADFLAKQKEFEEKAKEEEEKNKENKEKLGNFYRDMENVILKHNCIAYLLQDYMALGKGFTNGAKQMKDFSIILSEDLEQYASLAKFMEQAFEWSIMDYTFYPYYWANRDEWQTMYLSESSDPLFRNFLQAGMARVIVTVKPGFEDAVQFFMCTGKIWNGGEVPVIGDPLYLSIVDELRQPTGIPQGKFWITRIPTTLTILQAESVGLDVDQPLPIFPETDLDNCENPKELETKSSFKPISSQLQPAPGVISTLPKD